MLTIKNGFSLVSSPRRKSIGRACGGECILGSDAHMMYNIRLCLCVVIL